VRLQLVLAGKGAAANETGVGPLAGVEQLVADDVLGPRELLAAHVAGELVVRLRAVRLQVLGQLTHLQELLPALAAREAGGAAVVGGAVIAGGVGGERGGGGVKVGMVVGTVAVEPALRGERQKTALKITHVFKGSYSITVNNIFLPNFPKYLN